MIGEFFIIKRKILGLARKNFVNNDSTILDLGCGDDPFYHKAMKGKILCLDVRKTKKCHFVGDACCLPLKGGRFDAAISINSFYYFENPFLAADEISRIMKKNGKLFLIMPFIYPIHDAPYDKYRFTEYGIRSVLGNSFKVREIEALGGIFNLPAVMLHSLIKGMKFLLPEQLRALAVIPILILYPFYILAQLFSLLDFIDKSRRWPTYYLVLAVKK